MSPAPAYWQSVGAGGGLNKNQAVAADGSRELRSHVLQLNARALCGQTSNEAMPEQIFRLLASRKGHFRLESGHHSDLWLDLEQLCLRPRDVRPFSAELANRLAKYNIDGICGALNEGAFLSLLVASELNAEFSYSERFDSGRRDTLYPVEYRIPGTLRTRLGGKRVAIVNDVISAGSAVRGTFADLKACGAEPVAVGALLVLGDAFSRFVEEEQVGLESIAFAPHSLWKPSECPLCSSSVPLENPSDSQASGSNAHRTA